MTEPTVDGQRGAVLARGDDPPRPPRKGTAHASSTAASAAESEPTDTSTGSGRMASSTRLPADSADASEVGSWAMTLVSPRSTVTRLVAPRNVMAITVPVSGLDPVPVADSGAFDA